MSPCPTSQFRLLGLLLLASSLSSPPCAEAVVARGGGQGQGGAGSEVGGGAARVASGLRPDLAAELFASLSHEWVRTRLLAPAVPGPETQRSEERVVASCRKIAAAIIHGAAGDELRVLAYMQRVCSSSSLRGKLGEEDLRLCNRFGADLVRVMKGDLEFNRAIDPTHFCQEFYGGALADAAQKQRILRLTAAPASDGAGEGARIIQSGQQPQAASQAVQAAGASTAGKNTSREQPGGGGTTPVAGLPAGIAPVPRSLLPEVAGP